MYVLVVNAGSSSLKYQVIDSQTEDVLCKGLCERVGYSDAFHKHSSASFSETAEIPMENHLDAMRVVLKAILDDEGSGISNLEEIGAVGHRIVHGGEYFDKSAIIDEDVIHKIELC